MVPISAMDTRYYATLCPHRDDHRYPKPRVFVLVATRLCPAHDDVMSSLRINVEECPCGDVWKSCQFIHNVRLTTMIARNSSSNVRVTTSWARLGVRLDLKNPCQG
jgi:hypothetical protein